MPQIEQLPEIFGSQLFWLLVVFGTIYFVIAKGMIPKVRSTTEARDEQIGRDLEKAHAARAEAETIEAEWRERMDAARAEAAKVAREAQMASAKDTEAKLSAAVEAIKAKEHAALEQIRESVAAARVEMEAVATEAAQQMVERLTGLEVSEQEAAKAIAVEMRVPASIDGGPESH